MSSLGKHVFVDVTEEEWRRLRGIAVGNDQTMRTLIRCALETSRFTKQAFETKDGK